MQQVRLGRSGLVVSRLAFGTWQLGGDWGPTDDAEAMERHPAGCRPGVTFFDTAQAYGFGQSEQLLSARCGDLRSSREQVVIATKGGLRPHCGGLVRDASARLDPRGRGGQPAGARHRLRRPVPGALARSRPRPFDETAEALAGLIAEGKIRHVGVSNFDAGQMETFGVTLPAETLQPPYDLFRRDIEAEVLPYTAAHDIGVLVYGPLAHGLLSGSLGPEHAFARDDWRSRSPMFQGETYARNLRVVADWEQLAAELGFTLPQLAIGWTLANAAVHVAIVGTRDRDHLDEALAASAIDLDDEVMQRIDALMVDAVPVAGPSPEGM